MGNILTSTTKKFVCIAYFLSFVCYRHYYATFQPPEDIPTEAKTDSDDFYELVLNDAFVDKSLQIKTFLLTYGVPYVIIRPKGWGKTTNFNMLKRFLEIEVNENGRPLPKNRRVNYELFAGGKIYTSCGKMKQLRPLEISRSDYVMALQGQFPVIFTSFKNVTGNSYGQIENRLKILVANLFRSFRYLLESDFVDSNRKKIFHFYCAGKFGEDTLVNGVKFLTDLLRAHFGKRVCVLIDDYDIPLVNLLCSIARRLKSENCTRNFEVLSKALQSEDFRNTAELLRRIHTSWLNNEAALEWGFLTGIYSGEILGNLDDILKENNLLNNGLSDDAYGFSKDEVEELSARVPLIIMRQVNLDAVKNWYGYKIRGNVIYNPRSIRHFLANERKFDDYWASEAGDNVTLVEDILLSDKMQKTVQDLIDGKVIYYRYGVYTITDDFTVLLLNGYLTPVSFAKDLLWWKLVIPNREIKNTLKRKLLTWVCDRTGIDPDYFTSMAEQLASFKVGNFVEKFRTLLRKVFPLVDSYDKDVCYNGIMKCLIYSFEKYYFVESNRHTSDGRKPSAVLIAKPEKYDNIIIIDYKIIDNAESLRREIFKGIQEIGDKVRRSDLRTRTNIRHVLKVILIICDDQLGFEYEYDHNSKF